MTKAAVVLAVVLMGGTSRAQTPAAQPVRLALVGELPFTAEEIEQTVAARLPVTRAPDAGSGLVVIGPSGPSGIVVQAGGKTQVVAVGERRGVAAARVVALVIADLGAQELSPPRPASATAVSTPLPAPAPVFIPAARDRGQVEGLLHRTRLTALATVSKGGGADEPFCGGVDVDLTWPLGRLSVSPALALSVLPRTRAGRPDEVSFAAATGRLSVGWRAAPVELLAGPLVSAYAIDGATAHAGVLAGAGAAARVVAPLNRASALVLSLRVDGFANRVRVSWGTDNAFATPRVQVMLGVGIAWGLGS